MTFVFPFLLGGLLLAGVPVLLHFLVRKKPKTLLFPAYRFLILKRRSNTRNLRLKHLLLLLLRMALIILVCLALARPRLFHEAIGLSREKPIAMVLIFDTSPSMEYKSGDMTRLDLAKRRSLELLAELPEDCRVMILDAADPSSFRREDFLPSLEKARQRIQSLTIRPMSAPVTKALDEAYRRFEEWDDQRMPRIVCIFSDRTKASWDTGVSAKRKDDTSLPQVLYFDVGIDDPSDLAILHTELGGMRQSFNAGEKIPLRAVVKRTGAKMSNTLIVQISAKKAAEQFFNAEEGKSQTLALEIDTAGLKPGLHQTEVKLETTDDALPHNNKRFVTFKIVEKPRVLVLADDLKKTRDFARALEVLHYAVTHKTAEDKNLNQYDAVFLVSVAAPTETLWQELTTYVKDGRGVCIIPPGAELNRDAYNNEAAQKVMPAAVLATMDGPSREWNLTTADWGNPFLAFYRKWLAEGDWDFIANPRSATRYWEVKPPDDKNVIVSYDGAPHPAIVERPASKQAGKVLLLTTPMDERTPAWNNYHENLTSFYLAMTMMCARHLSAAPEGMTLNYQFDQKLPMVTKALAYPKYLLTSGDFSEEIRFDENRWTAERLPRGGNYAVSGTNPVEQKTETIHQFSINIASEESDLSRVGIDEIEAALGKNAVVPQDRRRSIVDTVKWDEPMELFPWLMIAILFFLALENLLANKFYQKASEPEA